MNKICKTMLLGCAAALMSAQAYASNVPEVKWDSKSLIINGQRVVPVMGEVHFSRIPAEEWKEEVKKMKLGGVTIIATYVFWNHIEEQ
ncbi:MAG: beta-galactosidase, partial [Prevotella sp.]|nr:beta-galactosidase [Prevotella sp.]